ncbi:MAG: glycoside hydrolase family 5 protein [Lentisphaeria bacterium]|nr:glycoside hydrolase family 5 protein [Lentisphaeria bacterium]
MRKLLCVIFCIALCVSLAAEKSSLGPFDLSRPEYLRIDNINLRKVYLNGSGEEFTLGREDNLLGGVQRQFGKDGKSLHQVYNVRVGGNGEILTLTEDYALLENGNVSWNCEITSDASPSVLLRHGNRFCMDLSSLALILNGMTVDGRRMEFEQQMGLGAPLSGRLPNYREISTIRQHGTLKIIGSGKEEAIWIDHRVVGNNEISLRFPFQPNPENNSIGLSLEFGYTPGETTFAAVPFFLHENDEWKPISRKALKTVKPNSILDFSFLQDKPAGKYGFLRTVGNHFEFEERPGVPVRLWGSNICFTMNFCTHEEAESLADQVAALGFNIVRFHHYDNGLAINVDGHNVGLDPEKKDRMNYLVYAFKKRGIYVNLDFYTYRVPSKTDIAETPNAGRNKEITKAMIYMSETGYEFYRKFILNLMSEVNPYTGMAWKDDPSLVSVCLVNEGNIHGVVYQNMSGAAGELVHRKFDALAEARKWDVNDSNRNAYFRTFVLEAYKDFYKKTTDMLRENGIKLLISDQNMVSSPEMALMRKSYDFVENHYYLNHPELIGKGWNLPERVRYTKISNTWDTTLHYMGPSRLMDKPFAITEWDFCRPSPYATEGGLAMGAFSSLQDWDLINHFSIAGDSDRALGSESKLSNFDIMNDPPRMFSDRIGSLLFLRGDVQKGKNAYAVLVPEDLYSTNQFNNTFPVLLMRLSMVGMTGSIITKDSPLPSNLRAVFGYTEKPCRDLGDVPYIVLKPEDFDYGKIYNRILELIKQGIIEPNVFDVKENKYTSDTGEICVNFSRNLFSVITPRTEGFSIMPDHAAEGNFLRVSEINRYCVIAATSYDGLPLAESRRIMISHLTEMVNDNTRFRNDGNMNIVEDWGSGTALLHLGKAKITLNLGGDDVRPRLFACDLSGERLFEVPFEMKDGRLTFTADNFVDGKAILTYELLRQ